MSSTKKKAKAAAASNAVINLTVLAAIVAMGDGGGYVSLADATPLATNTPPFIEMNPDAKDENGNIGVRATEAGKAYSAANPAPAPAAAATADKPKFVIVNVALPDVVRKGGGNSEKKSIYPFDDLPAPTFAADGSVVGGFPSFFVPATAERPNPAKKLASTVSSATRRYAVKSTTEPTKQVERAKKDAAGEFVLDANGAKIMETVTIDNMIPQRQFAIREVGPDAESKDGTAWGFPGVTGAAIFRVK